MSEEEVEELQKSQVKQQNRMNIGEKGKKKICLV